MPTPAGAATQVSATMHVVEYTTAVVGRGYHSHIMVGHPLADMLAMQATNKPGRLQARARLTHC